jgi:hypothetical protein
MFSEVGEDSADNCGVEGHGAIEVLNLLEKARLVTITSERLRDRIDILTAFELEFLRCTELQPAINRQLHLVDIAADDEPCVANA